MACPGTVLRARGNVDQLQEFMLKMTRKAQVPQSSEARSFQVESKSI